MVPVFFIFLVGATLVVVAMAVAAQSRKSAEAWAATAQTLGLMYDTGGAFRGRTLSGQHRGNDILVDTFTQSSGKSSTTYTRYRIRYPRPLGLGLKISRESLFSGFSKFFGAQDIQLGDAVFDKGVMIKGDVPAEIVTFLTLARRARIHRALMSFSGLKITDTEICWQHVGVERFENKLVHAIRRLSLVAWFLCGDREEDQPLERAARAKQEGRIDDAMRAVKEVPTLDNVPPIEARLMEAHMLHLANRNEEAGRLLDEAAEQAPEDEEIQQWKGMRESAKTSSPPVPSTTAETVVGTPDTEAAPDAGLAVESVCDRLFKSGGTSADADAAFAKTFEGQRIAWRGILRSYQGTSFDFIFGDTPCTKATLDIYELTGERLGRKQVQAIVQLPPEAKDALPDLIGREVTFTGQLLRVDGLMRNIFVSEATVV